MHPGRAEVGLPATLVDLGLEPLVLPTSDVGELLAVRPRGGPGVEEDREVEPRRDPFSEGARQGDAVVDRRRGERDERDDVHRADARVLADVAVHIDLVDGRGDQPLQRLGHRAILAGEREHRPVVAGIARPVEQVGLRHGPDGIGEPVDDIESTALRDVGDGFDQHPSMLSLRRVRRRPVVRRFAATLRAVTDRPASLLRHRDFVRLWTAETISQFGTQVSTLAIPLIAATVLEVSPFEFGLLATIEFLPFILLSLPAGVWVDRLRRRPILIAGDLGRAAALASIPLAFALGGLTIWQLYIVGFIVGCLTVFFDVAYQSYLPALVERDQLVEGNSKLEISRSAAAVLGPGLTGVAIGVIGAAAAIVVDVVSFVASAFFLWRIKREEPDPRLTSTGEPAERGPGMRREVAEGLRYVLGNRYLRSIAACTATNNLFFNIAGAILILYAVQDLALGPAAIGVVFSIGALGFLAGAFLANRVAARIGVGPAIVGAAFLSSPAAVLIAAAPAAIAIPCFIVAFMLEGLSQVIYNINQVSFRQAITPGRMQGRMNATMRFIVWGTIPIGALTGGTLGGIIGLQATLWVAAIGLFIPFLFVLFSPVRGIRVMPEPIEEPQPA